MSDVEPTDAVEDLEAEAAEVDVESAEAHDEPAEDEAGDEGAPNAQSVLTYLVQQVVDDPDAVSVSTTTGRRGNLQFDVRVGDGDMGRVIGKRGRIAQSIRTVTRAAAVKDDAQVDIEFVD